MNDRKILALRRSFLFSSLTSEDLLKIASIAEFRQFDKNEVVFDEGEGALGFYIVARGKVKVYKLSASGGEHILHIISEGASFAEAVVFGKQARYPAFAEAVEISELLFIPRDPFLSAMKSDFSLAQAVMASLAEKLRYFNALVEELSLMEADARLAKYLLDLSFKKNSASFALDVKKVELAKKLGIAPETLSRIFRRFKLKRIIRLSGDKVTVLNKTVLQSISSGAKA